MSLQRVLSRCALSRLIASIAMLSAVAAPAQIVPPDAGRTLQQLRTDRSPPASQSGGLLDDKPASAASSAPTDADAARVRITAVHVVDARAFDVAVLEALLADLPGHDWSLPQLRQAADRITDYYHRRSYRLARAYVPAQTLRNGELRIAVIEGRLGEVRVNNATRLDDGRLREFIDAQFPTDTLIETAAANRGLLVLQSLPGVARVDGSLEPGTAAGTTALRVKLYPQGLLSGSVGVDNAGSRYTGKTRVTAGVSLANPSGYADRLDVQGLLGGNAGTDQLMQYARVAWDLPLGNDGLRWGLAYSELHYRLGDRFASLEASGRARASSVQASYPLLLRAQSRIWLTSTLERRLMDDLQQAVDYDSRRDLREARLGLDAMHNDRWLAQPAANSLRLEASGGVLGLRSESVAAIDSLTARTAGRFNKLTLDLSREQALPASFSLLLAASVQQADRNLDSSEEFALGGPTRVRAYPVGEASGDEGWFASLELRRSLKPWAQVLVFCEGGEVRLNHRPYSDSSNIVQRSGGGLGATLRWQGYALRSSLAWRLGGQPATAEPDRLPLLWITASRSW